MSKSEMVEQARRKYLTREEAARVLDVSKSTMARWAIDRVGPPFVKITPGRAGVVRYPIDELEKFLASRLVAMKNGQGDSECK